MNEAPRPASVTIDKRDRAIVAQPQTKLMDDEPLKTLDQLINQNASAQSGITLVVLDLCRVQILPSLALGLLVQICRKCKARQQNLILAALQPQIRQVFSVTRLDQLFEFADTVENALK